MAYLARLLKKLGNIHRLSKLAIKLGAAMMALLYLVALLALLRAPHAADYFYVISVYRTALEAAPACLAVGVCAGLLGDLILRGSGSDNDSR